MPTLIQPPHAGKPPEFLAIGHVARDIQPDGSFSLGGTVTFAALTAYRLGLAASIITCADAGWLEQLSLQLPGVGLAGHTSLETTMFINTYNGGFRTQYLQARADELVSADLYAPWMNAPIVLFGPLDQEFTPELVRHFPRSARSILAVTPQGWLRRWDPDGRVQPTPWTAANEVLPLLDALILSHDDLLPFANGNRAASDALLAQWSKLVPLLVATDGRHGATLFQNGAKETFPAYTAVEVDPTGAGDVFACAFLAHLYWYRDPRQAVDFANCAASLSIEQKGITGIPTLEQVQQRMKMPHLFPG